MVKLFSVKCSNKRICCVSNNPKAFNPFLNENLNMSVFFVDCPKILFWSVLPLSCCCLFKIYTSYIISKRKSVKMINIPWFLVPHFYLLTVQSYKRLKLRAFKVGPSPSKNICVIYLIESPLKLMKNAFISS